MKLTPVFLNVYDLDFCSLTDVLSATRVRSINTKTIPLGFGAFHTGLEIFGKEISFSIGGGIHVIPPRTAVGAQYREAILLGETDKTPEETVDILELMLQKYQSHSYNVLSNNCNHFTNDLSLHLLGVNTPSFINKLAHFMKHCTTIIPDSKLVNLTPEPILGEAMVDCLDKEVLLCVLLQENASYYQCSIPGVQKTAEADFLSLLLDPNLDERGSILQFKSNYPATDVISSSSHSFSDGNPPEKPLIPTKKPLTPTEKPLTSTEKPLTPTEKPLTSTEKSPRKLSKITSRLRSRSVPKSMTAPPLYHSSKNKPIGIIKPQSQEFHAPLNPKDTIKCQSPVKFHTKSNLVLEKESPLRVKKSSRNSGWFRKEKEENPEKLENLSDFLMDVKDDQLSDKREGRSKSSPKNLKYQQNQKSRNSKFSKSKSPQSSYGKNHKLTKKREVSPEMEQDRVPQRFHSNSDGRFASTVSGDFKLVSRKYPEEYPPATGSWPIVDHEPQVFSSDKINSRIPEIMDGNFIISSSWPSTPRDSVPTEVLSKELSKSEPLRKKDGIKQQNLEKHNHGKRK